MRQKRSITNEHHHVPLHRGIFVLCPVLAFKMLSSAARQKSPVVPRRVGYTPSERG
jgi:hypothetical protein